MKATKTLVAAFVLFSLGTAVADQHEEPAGMFRQSMMENELMASRLIGMRVYATGSETPGDGTATDNTGLEDVGEINDLIVNRDGTIDAVLVDIGGFLGMGERQVAIGMSSVEFRDDASTDSEGDFLLAIPATQAMMESAPEYDMSILDEMRVEAIGGRQPADNMATDAVAPLDSSPRVTGVTEQEMMDNYVPMPIEQVTSDHLQGARVYTSSGEDIGEVSELLLDGTTIDKAVIDIGGFLGIGEKPVALDMADLEILQYPDRGDIRVQVPMDKEQLEALPEYE